MIGLLSVVFLCNLTGDFPNTSRILSIFKGLENEETIVIVVSLIHDGLKSSLNFFRKSSNVRRYENVLLIIDEYIMLTIS
jgi:hypothetical protein